MSDTTNAPRIGEQAPPASRQQRRDAERAERRRYSAFAQAVRLRCPDIRIEGRGQGMKITGPQGFKDRHEFKALVAKYGVSMSPAEDPAA